MHALIVIKHCYVSSHILISSFMCCFWAETKSPDTLWRPWYPGWCCWSRIKSGANIFTNLSLVSSVYREKSFRFFQSPDSLMPCSLVCQFLVKILILLSCYAGEISRCIYATFNHEVAATFQLWQRSISTPWMLYIYCTGTVVLICGNHLCSSYLTWKSSIATVWSRSCF